MMVTKNFKKHINEPIIWAAYIAYEILIIGLTVRAFGHPITYLAHYAALIGLFYVHALKLLPWSLKSQRQIIWRLPFILVFQIAVFIFINYWIDLVLVRVNIINLNSELLLTYDLTMRTVYRGSLFLVYGTGYYYLVTYIKEKRKSMELERKDFKNIIESQKRESELSRAQNAFLKAQINPHFLFNTLDFVYHKVNDSSPDAGEAIMGLSEMMRYAIDSEKAGEYVILEDEIEQVEIFLNLYRLRKEKELNFILDYGNDVKKLKFIPLVLLTLVENIFKHGNITSPEYKAVVKIYAEKDQFFLTTQNQVSTKPLQESFHTGLNNITERLKFAYGEKTQFIRYADEGIFFTKIILPLSLMTDTPPVSLK